MHGLQFPELTLFSECSICMEMFFFSQPLVEKAPGKNALGSSERQVVFLLLVADDRSRLAAQLMEIVFLGKKRMESVFLGKKRCDLEMTTLV